MVQILRCIFFVLFIECAIDARSQVTATLVKDIAADANWSDPAFLVFYKGEIYFRADDKVHGKELWKSNGTAAGTVMVKDIYPGADGSGPENLAVSNGFLYFSADDGVNGAELWQSDGTEAGTQMLKDITPGDHSYPSFLTDVNGILYFAIDYSNPVVANRGLWKTDGTAAGTVLVAGTYSNSVGSNFIRPTDLVNVNGTLYFIGNWPSLPLSHTLWKSDGTAAGTVMVSTNTSRFPYGIQPSHLAAFNNEIYFAARNDSEGGEGLWKSDGTDAGTVMVKDMNPSSTEGGVQFLANINNTLYFAGNPDGINSELWKSDGTGAGTVLVKDIDAGSNGSQPFGFESHVGLVYFTANTGIYGREIWRTDGTSPGTMMVADFYEDASSSVGLNPYFRQMVSLNGDLYFIGILDNGLGQELYKISETVLPVLWQEVRLDCKNGLPHLYWKTAMESGASYFIVQKSVDAVNWVNADTIKAVGNSPSTTEYHFVEKQPFGNYRFYRIVQKDLNGKMNFSEVKNVICEAGKSLVSIHPNPATESIILGGINPAEIRQIEIFDVSGKRVLLTHKKQSKIDVHNLPKGFYQLLVLKDDGERCSLKFIRQ